MASSWKGTLFLDEFEPQGDGYSEMIAFLKSGVGNRAVLRTEGDRKREVKAYLIKSMKIFTSEQPINNAGLRSRMFVIQMDKSTRRIPLIKQPHFYKEAEVLRNKLLLWRLRNVWSIKLEDIEFGYPELSGFDRRVQQVITPIYYLSDVDSRAKILEFASSQEKETKMERLDSLEGQIFQLISDSFPANTTVKLITDSVNSDKGRRPYTEKKIANMIRKVLQFDIQRLGHENISTVMASDKEDRIHDLRVYFGIPPTGSVASVASDANGALEPTDAPNNATPNATPFERDTSGVQEELIEQLDENGVPIIAS